MIRIRTVLLAVLGAAAVAVGLALPASAPATAHHAAPVVHTMAVAQPAAAAGATVLARAVARVAKRACKLAYTITRNTKNIFEIKFTQTCGISYRAWRRWGGSDYDLGTYRKCPGCTSNYSTACDVTSCQSHPDGAPFCYGYQRKDTGAMTTLGGCSSRSLRRHNLDLAA